MEDSINKEKELRLSLDGKIVAIKGRIPIFLKKYPDLAKVEFDRYIIFIFSINSVFLMEDILILIDEHKKRKNRIKRGIHTISRNLLELYFYFRYITTNKSSLELKSQAFMLKSELNEKKLFESFKKLHEEGKFIFSDNEISATNEKSINARLKQNENLRENLLAKYGEDLAKEYSAMKTAEAVCKKYDEENGIIKVEKGRENLSLEWCYNFLYRFQSMYTHQGLRALEDVIDIYYKDKKRDESDVETIALIHDIAVDYLNNMREITK